MAHWNTEIHANFTIVVAYIACSSGFIKHIIYCAVKKLNGETLGDFGKIYKPESDQRICYLSDFKRDKKIVW